MIIGQYFENLTLLLPEAANICTAGTHLYGAQTKPISRRLQAKKRKEKK